MIAIKFELPARPTGNVVNFPTDETMRRRRLLSVWNGAPGNLLDFDGIPSTALLEARQWRPSRSVIIYGESGMGKSALAVRLLQSLLTWGSKSDRNEHMAASTAWVRASEIILAGKRDNSDDAEFLHRVMTVRHLFLDDMSRSSETLNRVLEARYDRKLAIVGTCGMRGRGELERRIGGQAPVRWILDSGKDGGFEVNLWGMKG